MPLLTDRSTVFNLGLRSPELQEFMHEDKNSPTSSTRGLFRPEKASNRGPGRRSSFGDTAKSYSQSIRDHQRSVQSISQQGQMARQQSFRKQSIEEEKQKKLIVDQQAKEATNTTKELGDALDPIKLARKYNDMFANLSKFGV